MDQITYWNNMSAPAPAITIDAALRDPQLLGAALGSPAAWSTWLTALKATFGTTLNRQERKAFEAVAGSRKPPAEKVRELWSIVGRGGGKSRISAAIAVYLACFQQHDDLDPGEVGYILVLAASRDQAGIVFSFAHAFLHGAPLRQSRRLVRSWRDNPVAQLVLSPRVLLPAKRKLAPQPPERGQR